MDKGVTDGSTSLEDLIDEGFLRWCLKEEKCPCPLNHVGLLKRNLCILDIFFFFLTEYRERREREKEIKRDREYSKVKERKRKERRKRVKNREGGGKREKEKFLMTIMDL